MPKMYQKTTKKAKKVLFDDPTERFFQAPRTSGDDRRSTEALYHAPEDNRDESDDEIDNLLAEDPLYEEKESSRQRRGSRLSKRKRRAIIFGMVTLTLGIAAALVLVGFHTHARVSAAAKQSAAEKQAQNEYTAAMDDIKDMTEIPSLAGILPLEEDSQPMVSAPVDYLTEDEPVSVVDDTIISVPATVVDWSSEEEDRIAYEAEVAKAEAEDIITDGPEDLSPEAVAQAQELNGQLDEVSADVAAMAEDSASKIEAHKGDPVQMVQDAAAEFWAWLDATWADIMGNSEDTDETIY